MEGLPSESCGILAGKNGRVVRVYPMANNDRSAATFFMDPKEQLKTMKEIRADGMEMVGIHHSHPETRAYPSSHDVKLAFYEEVSYVIISLKEKGNPDIRSFKISGGNITEEEVKIQ